MAWARKLLRVNLTAGTCTGEPLNMEWAKKYLGGRGLATKYLYEEIDPKCDPLSDGNKLIMVTGPMTGTAASTGGRYMVVTKGALTGAIACSNSGGYFGNEMKNAGWDMIIFEGTSAKPVFLNIENDKAELLDAAAYWGSSTWDTEDGIKEQLQDPQVRVASIGLAGETGNLFAGVVNDRHRAAGRSGVGTVMGVKNLKAVAIRGTLGVSIDNPEAFFPAVAAGKAVLAENPVTGAGLPTYGTQVLMNVINESGALPTRNAKDVQFEGANDIGGEAMHEKRADGSTNLVSNQACFGCTIACGRVSKIDRGHFSIQGEGKDKYKVASGGLEYENAWALGAATGVSDLEALTYVNFLCNEQGMDPITLGTTIGAAMDLVDNGKVPAGDLDGVTLRFGSAEDLVNISEMTALGQGFGKEIAQGSKRMCEKYGDPDLSMSVKGQEFPAYDPRAIQGMGLTYATSNRGACHVRSYTVSSEIMGVPEKTDPLSTEGKAGLVMAFQDATAAVDSSGLCLFTTFGWSMEDIAPQVDAACEGDWSVDNMMLTGARIWNLERQFNLAAGLTAKDDTLPKRLLKEAAKTGPAKGMVNKLGEMLPEYYQLRGWNEEGIPTNETLNNLAL